MRKFYHRHIIDIPRIKFSRATKRLDEKTIFQGSLKCHCEVCIMQDFNPVVVSTSVDEEEAARILAEISAENSS